MLFRRLGALAASQLQALPTETVGQGTPAS
jgi:hypothetical protein